MNYCAVIVDGDIWVWGKNNKYGQMGTGNLEPVLVPTKISHETKFQAISCSKYYMAALSISGELYISGHTLQTTKLAKISHDTCIVQIATGREKSAFLDARGRIFLFLTEMLVELNVGELKIRQISYDETLIMLTEDGEVYNYSQSGTIIPGSEIMCYNPYISKLAVNNIQEVFAAGYSYILINTCGETFLQGRSYAHDECYQKTIINFDLGHPLISMAASSYHTMLLTSAGDIYHTGRITRKFTTNRFRFIKRPYLKLDIPLKFSAIHCGEAHSLFVTTTGKLYYSCCGDISQSEIPSLKFNNSDILMPVDLPTGEIILPDQHNNTKRYLTTKRAE